MAKLHISKMMIGLFLGIALSAGCGSTASVPDIIEQNSLIMDKEGHLTAHIVDVFDKDYYDLEGLKKMAQEEVDAYLQAHADQGQTVSISRVEKVEGHGEAVVVTYEFADAASFAAFTDKTCFYGTAEQAQAAGIDPAASGRMLRSADGNERIAAGDLLTGQQYVLLVSDHTKVYCPYRVLYISEQAQIAEDGSVDTTGVAPEEYPVVIVLDQT